MTDPVTPLRRTTPCPVHADPNNPTIRCTCDPWSLTRSRCQVHDASENSGPRCTCDTDGWTTDFPGNWGVVPIHWHVVVLHDLPERLEYRRDWERWTHEEAEVHAKKLTADDTARAVWVVSCPDNCVWDLLDVDDIESRKPWWTPAVPATD
jgi:hypothetical protein